MLHTNLVHHPILGCAQDHVCRLVRSPCSDARWRAQCCASSHARASGRASVQSTARVSARISAELCCIAQCRAVGCAWNHGRDGVHLLHNPMRQPVRDIVYAFVQGKVCHT